jgi:hypothetical protein
MHKNNTYRSILILGCILFFISCNNVNTTPDVRQQIIEPPNPYAVVDKSPMDISYYPVNYPTLKMDGTDSSILIARLMYSRPQKNGRIVFGNDPSPKCIQQYGAYWRLGANEASEIEFFQPVTIEGQKIAKGRYIIYCIPFETEWTIVLNSNLFSWGLHQDSTKDIARIKIPVTKTNRSIEFFTMVFHKSAIGADLIMVWDNVKAVLPISF